jgi:SNF2 family DNA or RNA helicase
MPSYRFNTVPYKHQEDCMYKLYGKDFFAIFAEQGTGKSKMLIDIVSNLYLEGKIDAVMLIAPNGVQRQWSNEQLPTHSPVPYIDIIWELSSSSRVIKDTERFIKDKTNTLKWFFVNVETFSRSTHLDIFRSFLRFNRTFLCIDEATRIKNPSAQRTINIIQGLSEVTKIGRRVTSVVPLSRYRAILTGTMVTNSPYDIWSMMEFLHHNYLGLDFFSFKNHYGIEKRTSIPGTNKSYMRKVTSKEMASIRSYYSKGRTIEQISAIMALSESSVRFIVDNPSIQAPYKNLDELKRKIEPVSFIVRKADCLDLPPKIYERLYVELSDEQLKAYKELVHNLSSFYKDKELSVLNKLTLLGRLQQISGGFFPSNEDGETLLTPFSSNPKLDALIEDLDECSDWPVIIVASFIAEIKAIYNRLCKEYPDDRIEYICGEVIKERADILEAFKRGDVKILVVNAKTVGSGYNLQISHVQYFYSNTYSMEDREQIEDRVHRDGQKSDIVLYKDILAKNTIDEKILSILKQKKDLLEYMRSVSLEEFVGERQE